MFEPDTLLQIAHEALYNATRSLRIAYVHEAIPEMWKAWRALRKFMFAKRHYFEGIQKQEIVNIEKERMMLRPNRLKSAQLSPR